jgi:dynein regulatory complex protein 1
MEDKKVHKGKDQVQRSKGVIEYMIRNTNEDLGVIKFKNEKKQKDTRIEEEARRLERYEEIQTESMNSNKKNVALEQRWNELKD